VEQSRPKSLFDEQMKRIHDATDTRTQMELANFLGIRQSSVSDAKKRQSIPAEWLITILRVKGVHPEWVLAGTGPCHPPAAVPSGQYETHDKAQEKWSKEEALRRLSSRDLAEELLRRIAAKHPLSADIGSCPPDK